MRLLLAFSLMAVAIAILYVRLPLIQSLDDAANNENTFNSVEILPDTSHQEGMLHSSSYNAFNEIEVWVSPSLQILSLAHKADTGDAEAAYQLSLKMRFCRDIPSSQSALENWLQQAVLIGEPNALIEHVLANFETCQGVELKHQEEWILYLLQAAEAGIIEAMQLSYLVSEYDYMRAMGYDTLSRELFIAKRDGFKQKKFEYLHRAAELGSIDALSLLGQAYQHYDPETKGVNYGKAMAHFWVFLEKTDDNQKYNKIYGKIQYLQDKMLEQDLVIAQEQAQLIRLQLVSP